MRNVPGHDVNYLSCAGVLGLSGRKGGPRSCCPSSWGTSTAAP